MHNVQPGTMSGTLEQLISKQVPDRYERIAGTPRSRTEVPDDRFKMALTTQIEYKNFKQILQ